MPQVPDYERQFDFTGFSTLYPSLPHRGDKIDQELNEIQRILDAAKANLNLIQRSDGQVKNLSIGLDQLKPEIVLGTPTDWVTGTEYEIKDVVWRNGVLYVCNTDHTSGTFATDLAAVYWTDYLDYADPLGDAADFATAAGESAAEAAASAAASASAQTAAEAAQTAAEAAQAAAEAAIDAITFPLDIGFGGTGGTTQATAQIGIGGGVYGRSIFVAANETAGIAAAILTASAWRTALGLGTAALAAIGTSGDTVPKNNTANTFSAAQIIALATAGVVLTLQSTDAGATSGPDVVLDRFSATPAASDVLASLFFRGRDSAGNATEYGTIVATITDPTNGSEDSYVSLKTMLAGVDTETARFVGNQILVQNGSAALPSYGFLNEPDCGFWRRTTGQVGLAADTVDVATIFSGGLIVNTGSLYLPDGSLGAGTLAQAYTSDNDTGEYRIGANNVGYAAGGALVFDYNTARVLLGTSIDLQLTTFGAPTNGSVAPRRLLDASITTGTPVAADAGKRIICTGGVTIPASVFAKGDILVIDAGASSRTITQGAGLTMTWESVGSTGNRTLAANGRCIVTFESATEATVSGSLTA